VKKSTVGGAVGVCESASIANLFASKYHDLYICVAYDAMEMQDINKELCVSIATSESWKT